MHASPVPANVSDVNVAFASSRAHSAWFAEKEIANTRRITSILGRSEAIRPYDAAQESLGVGDVRRPLITVVDDEAVIAITLSEILSRHGFAAVWFTEPAKALQFARCCDFDLLVTDVNMPALDGITLAEGTLRLRPDCAIVLLSSKSFEDEIRQRALSIGSDIHLEVKPVRIERLLATVRNLIARRIHLKTPSRSMIVLPANSL